MPGIRELLERFRPAGTPGGAGGAAVPVDRAALTDAELAPVFAALAQCHADAARIRAEAAARAADIRGQAAGAAGTVLGDARRQADAVRAAAFEAARSRAAEADAGLVDAARRQAAEARDVTPAVTVVLEVARAAIFGGAP